MGNHEKGKQVPMKAVMSSIPPEILQWRKRTGADRWDEMWDGVLHMAPTPSWSHQDFEGAFETWLRAHVGRPRKVRIVHTLNLASPNGWPNNYRVPDLILFAPERDAINCDIYLEGAPDVVVEIESPGDESREKFPFYAALGVPEVWIIHRDTKDIDLFFLEAGAYRKKSCGPAGWVLSPFAGIEMRAEEGKLLVRLQGDEATLEALPPPL